MNTMHIQLLCNEIVINNLTCKLTGNKCHDWIDLYIVYGYSYLLQYSRKSKQTMCFKILKSKGKQLATDHKERKKTSSQSEMATINQSALAQKSGMWKSRAGHLQLLCLCEGVQLYISINKVDFVDKADFARPNCTYNKHHLRLN